MEERIQRSWQDRNADENRIFVRSDDYSKRPPIFTYRMEFSYCCPVCGKALEIATRTVRGKKQYRLQHFCREMILATTKRWYPTALSAGNAYFKKKDDNKAKEAWQQHYVKAQSNVMNCTIPVERFL